MRGARVCVGRDWLSANRAIAVLMRTLAHVLASTTHYTDHRSAPGARAPCEGGPSSYRHHVAPPVGRRVRLVGDNLSFDEHSISVDEAREEKRQAVDHFRSEARKRVLVANTLDARLDAQEAADRVAKEAARTCPQGPRL